MDSGIEVTYAEVAEMDFREWPVLWLVTGHHRFSTSCCANNY
jgi:hypothetical protein